MRGFSYIQVELNGHLWILTPQKVVVINKHTGEVGVIPTSQAIRLLERKK